MKISFCSLQWWRISGWRRSWLKETYTIVFADTNLLVQIFNPQACASQPGWHRLCSGCNIWEGLKFSSAQLDCNFVVYATWLKGNALDTDVGTQIRRCSMSVGPMGVACKPRSLDGSENICDWPVPLPFLRKTHHNIRELLLCFYELDNRSKEKMKKSNQIDHFLA